MQRVRAVKDEQGRNVYFCVNQNGEEFGKPLNLQYEYSETLESWSCPSRGSAADGDLFNDPERYFKDINPGMEFYERGIPYPAGGSSLAHKLNVTYFSSIRE